MFLPADNDIIGGGKVEFGLNAPIWDVAKESRMSRERGKEEEESISFQFHLHQICIKSRVARGDYVTPNFNPGFETADERSTPQGALNQKDELTLQTRFRWPCWTALGSPTRRDCNIYFLVYEGIFPSDGCCYSGRHGRRTGSVNIPILEE